MTSTSRPLGLRTLAEIAASAGLYWVAGRLALLMAIPPGYATAIWPAAGIALVCVLAWGPRVAPGIAIGSMLVNIGTSFDDRTLEAIVRSIAVATSIGVGAAAQAWIGGWLVRRRVAVPTALETESDILRFIVVGGPIACLVASTVGVTTLTIAGVVDSSAIAFNWSTWWVGDTIGVMIFAPLALLVARPGGHAIWRRRRWIVGLPLTVGFCAATVLFLRASTWEQARVRTDFERRSAPVASVLRSHVATYAEVVAGLASFFDSSERVTRDEFAQFCRRAIQTHPGLLAMSWNPIVSSAQRSQYEVEARREGLASFTFTERGTDGELLVAAERPEYVPVYFVEPPARNARALGFDTWSDAARRDVLTRARAIGRHVAVSAVVNLIQGEHAGGSNAGVLLAAPVAQDPGSATSPVVGFVIVALRVDDLLRAALREVDHDGMAVTLDDVDEGGRSIRAGVAAGTSTFAVAFGDRAWRLSVVPTPAYLASQRSWQAWFVLAGGLLFIGLLGVALLMITGRASRLESLTAAAAASETKYRALYEDSPDMYLTAELEVGGMVVADCNQTLCDQLGYTRAELIGRPFHAVYHATYIERAKAHSIEFDRTGEFTDVERTLRTKDGGSIEASLNLRAIRDPKGAIIGARAVWRDITTRKQVERDRQFLVQLGETLRSSPRIEELLGRVAEDLRAHLDLRRCAFVEVDSTDGRVTIHDGAATHPASDATITQTMFSAETTQAQRDGTTVILEDTSTDPRTAARYETAYRPLGVRAIVAVPLLRDGVWAVTLSATSDRPRSWAEREITLVKLVAEHVWSWVEHLRILAELRATAVTAAVQHSEQRFSTLVQGVKDYAIFRLDEDGNVATWNAAAAKLTGYASDEIIGVNQDVFHTAEDRAAGHAQEILTRTRQLGHYSEERWNVRKDGTRFWAELAITPMFDHDDAFEGYANVMRDFTERRNQQEALQRNVREREVLLQEVHHRVKNNLQVISSLISLQARRLEPGATREALNECKSRVLAIALIHEKLYQSKDYSQVRFVEYARNLASNVFSANGVTEQSVALELDIDDIPLTVDRAIPCGLVINELISNALKHGLKDRPHGTIRVEMKRTDDGKLRLGVRDDGVGLPDGFELRTSTSMGLQLVSTLARQLEAEITVRGDGGSSFQLTFAE